MVLPAGVTPALWPFNLALLAAFAGYFSFLTFLPAFLVRQERF